MPGHVHRRPLLLSGLAALAGLLVIVVSLADRASSRSAGPTVYAAASLRDVLPKIDDEATFSFAGSGTLQQQIERGAPADLFAAASPKEPAALREAGRCAAPVTFATNRLVLVVPRENPAALRSVRDLERGERRRLAIGGTDVPVGAYSRTLLETLGLEDVLERNVVSEEASVSGIVAKVALGSADAGFVYRSDARAAGDRLRVIPLPDAAQPPIRYALCLVRRDEADTRGAREFAERVLSSRGRRLLLAGGFGVPRR